MRMKGDLGLSSQQGLQRYCGLVKTPSNIDSVFPRKSTYLANPNAKWKLTGHLRTKTWPVRKDTRRMLGMSTVAIRVNDCKLSFSALAEFLEVQDPGDADLAVRNQ